MGTADVDVHGLSVPFAIDGVVYPDGYAFRVGRDVRCQFEGIELAGLNLSNEVDGLLLDFLEFMLEEFEARVPETQDKEVDAHLDDILDRMVAMTVPHCGFLEAMIELRAQAAHDDRYRNHFTRHDQVFRSQLADLIQAGIEEGVFRDVDPNRVSALLLTVITGSITQYATTETDVSSAVREELDAYVEQRLVVDAVDR